MISVVVPTFDRPESLTRAVKSLFNQTLTREGFDLIIVDNTPTATATEAIAMLRHLCPESINFIALHEPSAGVANARNCAMSAVSTDLVAFLDDDQSAPETWLENLRDSHRRFPAAVTFGPVKTALPAKQDRHNAYFQAFFARDPDLDSGFIDDTYGCGNALIDFSKVPGGPPWFDAAMNEIGGEDDVLFVRVRDAFGRFAWAADAPVFEHPPIERVKLRYTLKRAFSYGQAPITLARRNTSYPVLSILFWMAVGAGKFSLHGLLWILLSLTRHERSAFQLDQAVRGLGKLLWWIDLRFYGVAALPAVEVNSERQSSPDFSKAAERA